MAIREGEHMNEWLVIKTNKSMKILTQKVKANELNDALNKAEEISDWKNTSYDDSTLEGLAIYPNDIQAIQEEVA